MSDTATDIGTYLTRTQLTNLIYLEAKYEYNLKTKLKKLNK